MKSPRATQIILRAQQKTKRNLSQAYLHAEIYDKLLTILKQHDITFSDIGSTSQFYHYAAPDDTRSLTHIAWQLFEDIDEILHLTNYHTLNSPDIQHFDISGNYTSNHKVRLTIVYSKLTTCETVYEEKLVKVPKTICIDAT